MRRFTTTTVVRPLQYFSQNKSIMLLAQQVFREQTEGVFPPFFPVPRVALMWMDVSSTLYGLHVADKCRVVMRINTSVCTLYKTRRTQRPLKSVILYFGIFMMYHCMWRANECTYSTCVRAFRYDVDAYSWRNGVYRHRSSLVKKS